MEVGSRTIPRTTEPPNQAVFGDGTPKRPGPLEPVTAKEKAMPPDGAASSSAKTSRGTTAQPVSPTPSPTDRRS
jgi:hypothetical protein